MKLGEIETLDQISAANYLIANNPYIDPQRVGIWGWVKKFFLIIHFFKKFFYISLMVVL